MLHHDLFTLVHKMFESQTVLRPIKFEVSIRLNLKVTINFTSTEIYAK